MSVTIDDVRALAAGLPRSYEVYVRGRVKFRVGRIVYLAFSRDETLMGYQWLVVRLEAIDRDELRELVLDAWRMVVPKKLASLSDDELHQQAP